MIKRLICIVLSISLLYGADLIYNAVDLVNKGQKIAGTYPLLDSSDIYIESINNGIKNIDKIGENTFTLNSDTKFNIHANIKLKQMVAFVNSKEIEFTIDKTANSTDVAQKWNFTKQNKKINSESFFVLKWNKIAASNKLPATIIEGELSPDNSFKYKPEVASPFFSFHFLPNQNIVYKFNQSIKIDDKNNVRPFNKKYYAYKILGINEDKWRYAGVNKNTSALRRLLMLPVNSGTELCLETQRDVSINAIRLTLVDRSRKNEPKIVSFNPVKNTTINPANDTDISTISNLKYEYFSLKRIPGLLDNDWYISEIIILVDSPLNSLLQNKLVKRLLVGCKSTNTQAINIDKNNFLLALPVGRIISKRQAFNEPLTSLSIAINSGQSSILIPTEFNLSVYKPKLVPDVLRYPAKMANICINNLHTRSELIDKLESKDLDSILQTESIIQNKVDSDMASAGKNITSRYFPTNSFISSFSIVSSTKKPLDNNAKTNQSILNAKSMLLLSSKHSTNKSFYSLFTTQSSLDNIVNIDNLSWWENNKTVPLTPEKSNKHSKLSLKAGTTTILHSEQQNIYAPKEMHLDFAEMENILISVYNSKGKIAEVNSDRTQLTYYPEIKNAIINHDLMIKIQNNGATDILVDFPTILCEEVQTTPLSIIKEALITIDENKHIKLTGATDSNTLLKNFELGTIDLPAGAHKITLPDIPWLNISLTLKGTNVPITLQSANIQHGNMGTKYVIIGYIIICIFILASFLISKKDILKLTKCALKICTVFYKYTHITLLWKLTISLIIAIFLYSSLLWKPCPNTAENYNITFAGVAAAFTLYYLIRLAKKPLTDLAPKLCNTVLAAYSSTCFFLAIVLISNTIVFLYFGWNFAAEQCGDIAFYLMLAGTIQGIISAYSNTTKQDAKL